MSAKKKDDGKKQEVIVDPLSYLVDALLSIEKRRVATQVRNTHLGLQRKRDVKGEELLERLNNLESWLDGEIAELIQQHPAYPWFSQVKGIGKENIAKVVGLVKIEKAPSISSLWKFAGYDVDNGKAPKRVKNKKLPYNSTLRTMCWRLGTSLMKAKGKYFEVYKKEKAKYVRRFTIDEGKKIVPALELPVEKSFFCKECGYETKKEKGSCPRCGSALKTKSKHVETDEFISEGHVHAMALRKMIKLFLSHLWMEWRKAEGLPVRDPYPHDKLGHSKLITAKEMMDRKKKPKGKKVS